MTACVPAWIEVSTGVCHIAAHGGHDGPLAAQVLDEDGRHKHGGQDEGAIDHTQGGDTHPLLSVQTTLSADARTQTHTRVET